MPWGNFLRGLGIYHSLRHPYRLDGALPHPLDDLGSKEPSFRPGASLGVLIPLDQVRAVAVAGEQVSDPCHLCADNIPDEAQFLLAGDRETFGNVTNGTIVLR